MRPMACATSFRAGRAVRADDAPSGPLTGPSIRALRERQVDGLYPPDAAPRGHRDGDRSVGRRGPRRDARVRLVRGRQRRARVAVGTFAELEAANPGLPIRDGFPAYVAAAARSSSWSIRAAAAGRPGTDPTGDGTALNVRALSQRCPHLGCRPNPCIEDYWFHCPCHQSRYDRLGIKAAGELYGPAPRGMDRYAIEVDARGVLTIDTGSVTLGPLPVALGQPGLIPPRSRTAAL